MSAARVSVLLAVVVALFFAASLMAGKVWVPLSAWASDDTGWWIIFELRLPRAILGVGVGAVLGLSGAVLQGYFRNPLADPGIVGVSSGAALGAVLAIFLGLATTPALLFVFAMGGSAIVMLLLAALVGRSASPIALVLGGTVLTSFAGALTTLILSLAPSPFATSEIVTWLMGALTDRGFDEARLGLPLMAAGAALLLTTGRALDALSLGEPAARSLGVNLARVQWVIVAGLGLAIGASVAVTGIVGFVGLIVPHLIRPLVGERPSALLIPSALGGAALVLAADSLVRLTPGAGEVRLGVAMALIGAPFFFVLMVRLRRTLAWS